MNIETHNLTKLQLILCICFTRTTWTDYRRWRTRNVYGLDVVSSAISFRI